MILEVMEILKFFTIKNVFEFYTWFPQVTPFPTTKSKYLDYEFFKYVCYLLVKTFPKTKMREQKKIIFWLIKNEDTIAGSQQAIFLLHE